MLHTNALYHADADDLLERLPTGTIDLVYFDPPWPQAADDLPEYRQFITPKIQHVHRVLAGTGNFFIHSDPRLAHHFRHIADAVFGEDNFRHQYILPRVTVSNDTRRPRPDYDVILFYGKSESSIYHPVTRLYTKDELRHRFPYEDERGRYRLDSLLTPRPRESRPTQHYEWQGIVPPKGHFWRYSAERLNEFFEAGIISFDLSKEIPSLKRYAADSPGMNIGSIWADLAQLTARMAKEENTGYVSQKPIDPLKRVIQIGSNPNGVVLDPFCGSGTTLVAAYQEGRQWIGCDLTQQAYRITLERLQSTIEGGAIFRTGDRKQIAKDYRSVFVVKEIALEGTDSASSATVPTEWQERQQPEIVRPHIITEGESDWKHLKAAYNRFKESGYLDEYFEIDFDERPGTRGESVVLGWCEQAAQYPPARPHIFIFDSDVDKTTDAVTDHRGRFKTWANAVFSFAIPTPSHRSDTPKISIEFFYQDRDLMRLDADKRRLFLSTEFGSTGFHKSESGLYCRELNAVRAPYPKIIEKNVASPSVDNLALSKNKFADYILDRADGFDDVDLTAFIGIFEIIREIIDAAKVQAG